MAYAQSFGLSRKSVVSSPSPLNDHTITHCKDGSKNTDGECVGWQYWKDEDAKKAKKASTDKKRIDTYGDDPNVATNNDLSFSMATEEANFPNFGDQLNPATSVVESNNDTANASTDLSTLKNNTQERRDEYTRRGWVQDGTTSMGLDKQWRKNDGDSIYGSLFKKDGSLQYNFAERRAEEKARGVKTQDNPYSKPFDGYASKYRAWEEGGRKNAEPLFKNQAQFDKNSSLTEGKETLNQLGGLNKDGTPKDYSYRDKTETKLAYEHKTNWADNFQSLLGVGGFIPYFGAVPDLINAGISGIRGAYGAATGDKNYAKHFKQMGMNAMYAVPIAGDALSGSVKASRLYKYTGSAGKQYQKYYNKSKTLQNLNKKISTFDNFGKSTYKVGGKLKRNWFKNTELTKPRQGMFANTAKGVYNTVFRKNSNTMFQDFVKEKGFKYGGETGKYGAYLGSKFLSGKGVKSYLGATGDDKDDNKNNNVTAP